MAPPSIQGVPIIEPTLPVGTDAITPPPMGNRRDVVPEGLEPLRPEPVRAEPDTPTPPVEIELGRTPEEDRDRSGEAQPAVGSKVPVEAASPLEERVDRRRREIDPTLFPVEDSVAPTKPGTSKASYEEWDALVNRIARERVPVAEATDAAGRVRFEVPSLSSSDEATLFGERYAKRLPGRLAAIHDQQVREINRVVRWVSTHGRDPATLLIDGRTARLGDAPESIRSLMSYWRSHPLVTAALRAESGRRAQAKVESLRDEATRRQYDARRPSAPTVADEATTARASRLAELAATYPHPLEAVTPQVGRLMELLRQDAPAEQIRAAAEEVRDHPVAREDVHRHRVELAQAYNSAIEGDDVANLVQGQRRGGR